MKKLLLLSILTALMFPMVSEAQIDQRCWIKEDCFTARETFLGLSKQEAQNPEAFRQDNTTEKLCGGKEDAAHKQIGFCLPATTAKTKISIGGVNEFSGLAEFIAFIYKYGLSVASILAVLMIIYAGVEWTISGGNTETISSAQHKITGAVIGLVILAAAYTILYTINPDLVNLRPPNAWMINTQKIGAPYCGELKEGLVSKIPSNPTGQILSTDQKKAGFSAIPSDGWAPTSTAECGNDYFVQQTGALTCRGTTCTPVPGSKPPKPRVCYDKLKTGRPDCHPANLAGKILSSSVIANLAQQSGIGGNLITTFIIPKGWEWIWVNQPELWAVCINGKHQDIDAQNNDPDKDQYLDKTRGTQFYQFTIEDSDLTEKSTEWCKDEGSQLKGFVIDFDLNREGNLGDEEHFIGRSSDGQAFDLGDQQYDEIECVLREAPAENFFTLDEIKTGKIFDVDVNKITRLASTQGKYDSDKNGDETHTMRKNTYKFGQVQQNCF